MNIRRNAELREEMAISNKLHQFREVVQKIKAKYEPYHTGALKYDAEEMDPSVAQIEAGVSSFYKC